MTAKELEEENYLRLSRSFNGVCVTDLDSDLGP